jgi:hypothetical protein
MRRQILDHGPFPTVIRRWPEDDAPEVTNAYDERVPRLLQVPGIIAALKT